jgi:hypothetical protein
VSLVFHDADGNPIRRDPENDLPLLLVRAHQTAGWVDAWRHIVAPETAVFLRVGFRLDPGVPDPNDPYRVHQYSDAETGEWWLDDLRLERVPLPTEAARGILCIHTTGGGARLRVVSTHGRSFAPLDAFAYRAGDGCFHSISDDTRLSLPQGSYTVEALRGFQREPFSKTVEIIEGHESRVAAELPRIADWPAHGWYAGDHHNHLAFPGDTYYPLMGIDDVCRIARGEGLDFLSFCGDLDEQHAYADWRAAGRLPEERPDGAFEREDFVGTVSFEARNNLLGHLCLINPAGRVQAAHPSAAAPTGADLVLAMRRAGRGAAAMAHPFGGLEIDLLFDALADPEYIRCYRELPADVALGFGDTLDILSGEPGTDIERSCELYYRLLNLGLRLGVAGSSGATADRGDDIVGSVVTFVRANLLTLDALAGGYEAQRTMASNGPLLRLRVNDKDVGSTVAGTSFRLQAEAYSNWGLSRLELLSNGEVIADAVPDEFGWARIDEEWTPARSGWVLARACGPGHPVLNSRFLSPEAAQAQGQWAISSPVYVEVPGRPVLPRREDADYFIRWTYACMEAIEKRKSSDAGDFPLKDEDAAAAMNLFRRGRLFFEDLREGSELY